MQQLNAHNSTKRERESYKERERKGGKTANCSGKVFAEKVKKVSLGQRRQKKWEGETEFALFASDFHFQPISQGQGTT